MSGLHRTLPLGQPGLACVGLPVRALASLDDQGRALDPGGICAVLPRTAGVVVVLDSDGTLEVAWADRRATTIRAQHAHNLGLDATTVAGRAALARWAWPRFAARAPGATGPLRDGIALSLALLLDALHGSTMFDHDPGRIDGLLVVAEHAGHAPVTSGAA